VADAVAVAVADAVADAVGVAVGGGQARSVYQRGAFKVAPSFRLAAPESPYAVAPPLVPAFQARM
jgi:hypothetical protein